MKRMLLTACFAALCLAQQSSSVARGRWDVKSDEQTSDGHIYHLRGHAAMETAGIRLQADQIDYDEEKAIVHLAGHVTVGTDTIAFRADDAVYDISAGEIQTRDVSLKLKTANFR